MKNKKETFEKIVLGLLTFILICYISISLVFLSIFNVSKKFLNKDNVSEFISDINVVDILREEFFQEFNIIETEFQNVGITTEGISEFVNSEEVKQFSENIVTDIVDNILNNNLEDYQISNDIVTDLLENNIDKLQTNSLLSEQQILNKLNSKIPNLVSNINNLINKLFDKLENSDLLKKYENYVSISIEVLDIIYSDIVCCLIIFILISFIALIIFIRRNIYKSLKWLSISSLIPSILLYLLSYIITHHFIVDNILINNILNVVCRDINMYSLIYMIMAIVIIVVNIIIFCVKKHKEKLKLNN